jgi:hypothetical protein
MYVTRKKKRETENKLDEGKGVSEKGYRRYQDSKGPWSFPQQGDGRMDDDGDKNEKREAKKGRMVRAA